ncbi:MAG: EI24 domain-containing protein [Oscillatoriaceae bacterium SKW80]|nr:EI24 domain-containing protein [Oscillatoriaceae bacterium SKYG93]MCX8121811.1 EI24 domain-containing protein [Oscillatoriaceae bacterium SKW80]MDW8454571.1 EI24 domain-containing protein [Oscillatoriaceae cyanobacterium SKYGB_i_bin93]HIK27385.1 EI24 domain-containing protein [Oscillatoriaceae cyanobacterium M7585_C2015_266]
MTKKPTLRQKSSIIKAPIELLAGATYPLRALGILFDKPSLWGYILIPILINFVVGIGLYVVLLLPGWRGVNALILNLNARTEALIANLPKWLAVLDLLDAALGWLLRLLLSLLLLIAIGLLLVQFGVILGAPFYGKLSEELELLRVGKLPTAESVSMASIMRDIGRALMHEVNKLILSLKVGLPLLLLNFVPGFGMALASIGALALAATLVCIDFLDAPLERRRLSFEKKLAVIKNSLPASATFGLVCLGLVSIPLLNLLAVPLCVTSGTLFFCDRILPMFDSDSSS